MKAAHFAPSLGAWIDGTGGTTAASVTCGTLASMSIGGGPYTVIGGWSSVPFVVLPHAAIAVAATNARTARFATCPTGAA